MALEDDFKNAKDMMGSFTKDPGNDAKLQIYGLFKQATEGKCNKSKPGMLDFVGAAKWEAWNSLGNMTKEEAMKSYVDLIHSLAPKTAQKAATTSGSSQAANSESATAGFTITKEHGGSVLKMVLNRPDKKNAITWDMYRGWAKTLNDAAKDDTVKLAVITGAGDYFCSGNDLSNFTEAAKNPKEMAKAGRGVLLDFIKAFIDFPKPLVGLINGPAVGISVTTLALYDAVVASDHATFHVPFSALGQTPEGCSSYLFPKIMGSAQAHALLMFNRKIGAQEACALGLVSQVVKRDEFKTETEKLVAEWAKLPPQTMRYSKDLIRGPEREKLHSVNEAECNRLQERWTSDECISAIMNFFQRKSKM